MPKPSINATAQAEAALTVGIVAFADEEAARLGFCEGHAGPAIVTALIVAAGNIIVQMMNGANAPPHVIEECAEAAGRQASEAVRSIYRAHVAVATGQATVASEGKPGGVTIQ